MKSLYNEKITTGNNGEQSCRISGAAAFRNITELAHNICSSHLNNYRNFKDKIKDLELSSFYKRFGSFKLRKYYSIGPV